MYESKSNKTHKSVNNRFRSSWLYSGSLCCSSNVDPILVYGVQPGGQLTTTTDVENYPGFSDVIQGPWLMDQMKDQAEAVGTEMIEDHISSVNLKSTPFEAIGDSGQKYTCLLYTSPSPRDGLLSRMPSSA